MKRLMAVTAAVASTAALTLTAAPAHAAVGAGRLLTAAQVEKVVGGDVTLKTFKSNTMTGYKGCKQGGTVKAKSGIVGSYSGASGVVVTYGVVQAKSVAQAKKLVSGLVTVIKKCKKITVAGQKYAIKKVKVPALGQQRAGFRMSIAGIQADSVVIRKGTKIVAISYTWTGAPQQAKATKLTKAAFKKA